MKAYKGFNKDMTCRWFQFEEGKTYELPEGETAKLCENGFHACEAPIDCFRYYAPSDSVYREVDLDGVTAETSDDSKRVGSKIRIGAKLDVAGIVQAQFEYTKEGCDNKKTGGDRSALTGGYRSALTGGDRSALTGGNWSALTGGDWSALTGGDWSALTGGNRSALTGCDRSALTGGYRSALTGGNWSALTGGYRSALTGCDRSALTGGDRSALTGGDRSALTGGYRSVIRGGMHSKFRGGKWAVFAAEIIDKFGNIIDVKIGVVDNETLKQDTWYIVEDGEWKEVEE